jgi:pimeloyl-ACP methyl ester carboxylesterase
MTPSINLDTHITDIVNVIKREELSDLVLVGHSYGGVVVTGVADTMPDRITSLVYLDAFVPEERPIAGKPFAARRSTTQSGRRLHAGTSSCCCVPVPLPKWWLTSTLAPLHTPPLALPGRSSSPAVSVTSKGNPISRHVPAPTPSIA